MKIIFQIVSSAFILYVMGVFVGGSSEYFDMLVWIPPARITWLILVLGVSCFWIAVDFVTKEEKKDEKEI